MTADLLPDNRTILEEALAVATDPFPVVSGTIEGARGYRYARPLNASVAPWLVYEYGLGPISEYFATVEDLIDLGRAWQRIRGTPAALMTALGWIGYGAPVVEDQVTGRRRWHLYQIGMGALPGVDESRKLADAEYLAGISDPARSEMFRGYHGYDVRGLAWGRGRYGGTLVGDSSGVRINGGSVKWSHGRAHVLAADAVVADWSAFGFDPDLETGDAVWSGTLAWSTPGLGWGGTTDAKALKTWLMLQRRAHLGFFDAADNPIGYACVIRAPVDVSGISPDVKLSFDVLTLFGDGDGETVASVSVLFDLPIAAGVKPFKAWLRPEEVAADPVPMRLGNAALAHTFQKTVRERITLTLTIPS